MKSSSFSFPCVIATSFLIMMVTMTSSFSQSITLKLKDGSFVIKGKLVKYSEKYYIISSTEFGEITVDANKFICISGACPGKKKKIVRPKRPITNNFGIHGSNTIGAQLMPALIEGHAKATGTNIKKVIGSSAEEIQMLLNGKDGTLISKIELHSHGSGTSFPGLVSGAAQIGMSSRPIKKKEQKAMGKAGYTNMKSSGREHILALDGLIVILSPSNPINSLRMEQIAQIFSGQITDWSEVGRSKPGKINIYARDVKSGTFDTFNSLVLKPYKLKINSEAKRFESNPDLSDNVARDPDGIGFTGFAYQRNSKAISISETCGILKKPTLFNVKTEEYPLARRLYLYTTADLNSPYAKKLLKYSMSDNAQNVISKVGFVNQKIDSVPFSQLGNHLAAAITTANEEFNMDLTKSFAKEFIDAQRLSVTFRFKPSSTRMTNKSVSDVKRLSKVLQTPQYKNKKIYIVGFSSSQGPFELNKEISFKRALRIQSALIQVSNDQISLDRLHVKSYGELFPVGCNETLKGRAKNQRVEIWIK